MILPTDIETFTLAKIAYDEHMLLVIGVSDPEEYLKIQTEATNKAATIIAAYRERVTNICF